MHIRISLRAHILKNGGQLHICAMAAVLSRRTGVLSRKIEVLSCRELTVWGMQGAAMTPEGWKYPPFIVIERGESLDEWQMRIQPDFPTIVQVRLSVILFRVRFQCCWLSCSRVWPTKDLDNTKRSPC